LVVELGSDCQRLLMEVPGLGVSSILRLDDKVSVVDDVKVSVFRQLRDNVEWSFNIEPEVFIEFSWSWFSLPFISVDNVPLATQFVVLVDSISVSSFTISASINFNDLSFPVGDMGSIILEHLPPS